MSAFIPQATAVLTSTTSTQAVTLPFGSNSLVVYNGGANPVYLAYTATVTIPTGAFAPGVFCVQPGTTQSFSKNPAAEQLAYIAATAGGLLVVSLGEGV